MGYLKVLNEKLQDFRRILIDQTGVGEVFVEEVVKSGLKNAQGIMLSLPKAGSDGLLEAVDAEQPGAHSIRQR